MNRNYDPRYQIPWKKLCAPPKPPKPRPPTEWEQLRLIYRVARPDEIVAEAAP